jgi:hypothetical protein
MQTFFESTIVIDEGALSDASMQLITLMQNPLTHPLVHAHLHPAAGRFHRNWKALRKSWDGVSPSQQKLLEQALYAHASAMSRSLCREQRPFVWIDAATQTPAGPSAFVRWSVQS